MACEGGEAIKERRRRRGRPIVSAARSRQRLSRQLRLDEIGEAAGATLEGRCDAHVVASGQMRGAARPALVLRPFEEAAPARGSKPHSAPLSSGAPSSIATEPNRAWKRWPVPLSRALIVDE